MLSSQSRRVLRSPREAAAGRRLLSAQPAEGDVRVEFDIPHVSYMCDLPPDFTYTNRQELLDMYELGFKMRRMEIAGDTLYKSKFVKGFCHLYDGQEAIVIGMEAATTFNDSLITSYRDHCQQLARGDTVEGVLSELLGKAQGCAKGKGGSMHMYKADANFFGGNGIVGAQSSLGVGLAFAHKYKGDGAANQGQLYEAMNMAALWKLPCIFVCENNQYGMGTSKKRGSANTDYYTRGHYVPGIKVDGMNALAVREVTRYAKAHALEHGPIVLEMDTYRYHGHSMSDPGITYRNRDEVAGVRAARDPVARIKKYLLDLEFATEQEIKTIDMAVKKEVEAAVAAAKAAPEPPMTSLYEDIYTDQSKDFFMRGCDMSASNGVYGVSK